MAAPTAANVLVTDIFDDISHPAGRELVRELREGPGRAGDLGTGVGMSREAISKHLRVMTARGLLTVETKGRARWYSLNPDALRRVDIWLTPYKAFWPCARGSEPPGLSRGSRSPHRDGGNGWTGPMVVHPDDNPDGKTSQ